MSRRLASLTLRCPPPDFRCARLRVMTNTPMPMLMICRYTNGDMEEVIPQEIGAGASRDVLSGWFLHDINKPWPYVAKVQEKKWHSWSNKHEADIALTGLLSLTPRCVGCMLVDYDGRKVSVIIFERVDHTMSAYLRSCFNADLTLDNFRFVLSLIAAMFQLMHQACVIRRVALRDMHTSNIGLIEQPDRTVHILLIDVERCFMPQSNVAPKSLRLLYTG